MQAAKQKLMINKYAAMCYVMMKEKADRKGIEFIPAEAEHKALQQVCKSLSR